MNRAIPSSGACADVYLVKWEIAQMRKARRPLPDDMLTTPCKRRLTPFGRVAKMAGISISEGARLWTVRPAIN
jgi:hypothetical protein